MRPLTVGSLIVTAAFLVSAVPGAAWSIGFVPEAGAAETVSVSDHMVPTVQGVALAVTVFRPAEATAAAPVPIVLHSHGWSGSRTATVSGIVEDLTAAGFGVISIDARGHGDSGGAATIHHKDHEVLDFLALLDWIHDNLDWVAKEASSGVAKDIVAGATGASYGGAFQLMTASFDDRLDALAPEITWTDLRYSLAPAGVVKTTWVDALYAAAKAGGTRVDPRIDEWWLEAQLTNTLPPAAAEHFVGSMPRLDVIKADVLLIQGFPDLLFNLNEAVANYDALEAGQAGDVRLVTHLTGHVLPGVQPIGLDPYRTDQSQTREPCGATSDLVVAWMEEKLLGIAGAADGIAEVAYALESGECLRFDGVPQVPVAVAVTDVAAVAGAGTVLVPVMSGPAVVAGVPRLTAGATVAGTGHVNVGLAVMGPDGGLHIVDDQSTPLRLAGGAVDLDLAGVATRLGPDDTLLLRIDGLNEWFAANGARTPGGALFTDVGLDVPLVGA